MEQQFDPIFVTVNEGKRLLACGTTRLYELMNAGKIEKVKDGSKTLITFQSVKRYAASLQAKAESGAE